MENNNQLKIFRQKFLRNAKHAISARGSSVDQQNALAPIRRVGSCKEGVYTPTAICDPPGMDQTRGALALAIITRRASHSH